MGFARLLITGGCLLLVVTQSFGAVEYWDVDGSFIGAGSSSPNGVWDAGGIVSNWNASADGTGDAIGWTPGNSAVFSAGDNAFWSYTVSLAGNPSVAGLAVEDGAITIAGGGAGSNTVDFGTTAAAPIDVAFYKLLTEASSVVFSGTGGLSKTGAGTLQLRGTNTFSKSGAGSQAFLTLSDGIVDFTADANLGAVPSALNAGAITMNGGTLRYSGSTDLTLNSNRGITIGAGGGTIDGTTGRILSLGNVTGSGTITKTGYGRLTFIAPSAFAGKYVVADGNSSSISSADDLGFGPVPSTVVPDYFTLTDGGSLRMDSISPLTLNANRGITLGQYGGTLVGPLGGFTYGGVIAGGADQTLYIGFHDGVSDNYDSGSVTLTGQSTYEGATLIYPHAKLAVSSLANGGTPSPIGASSNAATNLTINGTLSYVGTGGSTDRALRIGQSTTIEANGVNNAAIAFTSNSPFAMADGSHTLNLRGTSTGDNVMGLAIGDYSPSQKTFVQKSDAGTWVLSNPANSYTDSTSINGGRLKLGASGVIPDASPVFINSSLATLDLNGYDETVKYISGSGTIALGSHTLTFANPSGQSYSGRITGVGGSIVKAGSGALTLIGTNTYTGDTTIQGGTLQIAKSYLADGSAVRMTSTSTFNLNFSGTDLIASLFIDGISQAFGLWGAVGSGAAHETSLLTGTGRLLVASGVLGDFNNNGVVDAADYVVWRKYQGGSHPMPNDPTGGTIGAAQFATWQSHFGQPSGSGSGDATGFGGTPVPEPATLAMLITATMGWYLQRRRVPRWRPPHINACH